MVGFRPYYQYLYVLQHGDAVKAANGSWETSGGTWDLWSFCREETNGRGDAIRTTDGKTLVYSSIVQLPKGTPRVDEGTAVMVSRERLTASQLGDPDFIPGAKSSGLVVAQGVCLKYDYGRLHCRLWI
jgi:hypothetical protein